MRDYSSFVDHIANDFSVPFVVINGTYGVGKTFLIHQSIEKILSSNEPSFIFYFNPVGAKHLTDFPQIMKVFSNPKFNLTIKFDDLNYFLNRYSELLIELTKKSEDLASVFEEAYSLWSYFEGEFLGYSKLYELNKNKEKIDELFEKNTDKRILLQLQNIIVESIIAAVVEASKELIRSDSKLRLYLIFDDFENYAYTVDEWIIKYWFNYLQYKTLYDFISYRIELPFGNASLAKLFDFKIVVATRLQFIVKRFQNIEPKEKLKVFNIQPLDISEIESFYKPENEQFNSNYLFEQTCGIPFNLNLFVNELQCKIDGIDGRNYFAKVYNKIVERYPKTISRTFVFLSFFESFGEDAIRCLPENLPNYQKIFKYLAAENEVCEQVPNSNELYKVRPHYQYFIHRFLSSTDNHSFENYNMIARKYSLIYPELYEFNTVERKILRNLAYFNEFDFGAILQKSFADDLPKVRQFVLEHQAIFERKGELFSLKEPLRHKLDELNQLVDNERYKLKKEFLNNIIDEHRQKWLSEIEIIRRELDDLSQEILSLETEIGDKTSQMKNVQQQLIAAENDLIESRSKHLELGRKYTWKPFIALVISAVFFFLLGNNIYNIFDETVGGSSIQGFAIAFKVFAVILMGLFFYLLIDAFGSKERKQRFKIISQSIKEGEERKYQLQLQMTQIGLEIKSLKERQSGLSSRQHDYQNKLEKLEKNLGVRYSEATK